MSEGAGPARVGELRPSQLLWAFGIGATVELPKISAIVMGLDEWPLEGSVVINEERLLAAVKAELGDQVEALRSPPLAPEERGAIFRSADDGALLGVPVAPFPRWAVCPYCRLLAPLNCGLFELKVDPYRKDRTRYVHSNCGKKPGKPPDAVPARFLVACNRGHLDDFPWVAFVHGGPTSCKWSLRIYELGASGEVAEIQVKCETCGLSRRMAEAFGEDGRMNMPPCKGRWPHLRTYADEGCTVRNVTPILLGATSSWFGLTLSTLAVPSTVDKLAQLVDEQWAVLSKVESRQNIDLLRSIGQLHGLGKNTEDQVWEAVEHKRKSAGEKQDEPPDLKRPEWEVFSQPDSERKGTDFRQREVKAPDGYNRVIERVVLLEKLREVQALVGFARIESPADFDIGQFPQERRAPLSRGQTTWVPACEVRGEGIFIQLAEGAVASWVKRVEALDREFLTSHREWRRLRGIPPEGGYPGIRFVLLHSLAHALLRQLALECGYATASIRERIYSRSPEEEGGPMAGILIYTAAPDSEGTLGGLVSLGEPQILGRHLDQALDGVRLCASDPLCAEHRPSKDGLRLHAAACHACLFAPETSCERGNKYLDRSVLVRTVDRDDVTFFEETP